MKRFLLLCKRQLMQPIFVILCLLLPVSCLLIQNLEQNSSSSLCIGLFAAEPDELTSACFSELTTSTDNGSLAFQIYTDQEAMKNAVATGSLDCAYSFDSKLRTHLMAKDYKKIITCYISPSSIMEDLSREVVFAALFRHFGEDIVISYAEESAIMDNVQDNKALRTISALYEDYLNGEEVFSLNYQYLDILTAAPSDKASAAVTMPVRGLIAVLLFVSGLTGGVTYLTDREKKLPVSAACSILIPLLFMAISSFLTLWVTGECGSLLAELGTLAVYQLLILLFVRLLLFIIKKPAILSASIPVFALGSLLFCPIFINLGAILPFFDVMEKLFLPYYYLIFSR